MTYRKIVYLKMMLSLRWYKDGIANECELVLMYSHYKDKSRFGKGKTPT